MVLAVGRGYVGRVKAEIPEAVDGVATSDSHSDSREVAVRGLTHPARQHASGTTQTQASRPGIASIVKESRRGLRFDPRIPFEMWRALGARIAERAEVATWWLGDWIVFGEQRYGIRYRDAIEVTGLEYQTLRNYAVVARRFELSRRRDNLSFQHHAEVCALTDETQEQWLDMAAEHRWSKRELRTQIRDAINRDDGGAKRHRALRLTVESRREQHWREAAAQRGRSFEDWVIESLDAAASP